MNDLTGGPVQMYLSLLTNGVLAVRMGANELQSFSIRRRVRKRILATCPEGRVHIDGITYH